MVDRNLLREFDISEDELNAVVSPDGGDNEFDRFLHEEGQNFDVGGIVSGADERGAQPQAADRAVVLDRDRHPGERARVARHHGFGLAQGLRALPQPGSPPEYRTTFLSFAERGLARPFLERARADQNTCGARPLQKISAQ